MDILLQRQIKAFPKDIKFYFNLSFKIIQTGGTYWFLTLCQTLG